MTTDTKTRIMDAAEKRIRTAGYNGFSFRELADDLGIKSASIHYHYPTKADLGSAVAQRYSVRFGEAVREHEASGMACRDAWITAFRNSLIHDGQMCLCGILAAEIAGLPESVAHETRAFFLDGMKHLTTNCDDRDTVDEAEALKLLASLEGAMLLARSMNDPSIFDQVTARL